MLFIYSLIIRIYGLAIRLASLWMPKAKAWLNGRSEQKSRLSSLPDWSRNNRIWIHAASYGEYEMARPIVDALLENPNNRLFISFFSPSGFNNHKFDDERIIKLYLPLDTKSQQSELVDILKPDKVLFIKYEIWYNLLSVLNSNGIPYYFSSFHLNKDRYVFNPLLTPFKKALQHSRKIYTHNPSSYQILEKKGFNNLSLLGDTRITQALLNKQASKVENLIWSKSQKCIVYGSVIPQEYQMLTDFINSQPNINHLIAPHDIDDSTIDQLVAMLKGTINYYSKHKGKKNNIDSNILIINTLGDLRYLYDAGDIAYVGAGFEKGPHNIIEPLIFSLPTCCGNNIRNFPMAQHLRSKEILRVIDSINETPRTLSYLLQLDREKFHISCQEELSKLGVDLDPLIMELSS